MAILIASTTLLAVVVAALMLRYWRRSRRWMHGIPGPPLHPMFDNLIELLRARRSGRQLDYILELMEQYGRTFTLKILGRAQLVFTSDPATLEYVLKTNFENFEKSAELHDMLEPMVGEGIFAVNGPRW
jgi:Cytochrome P450